MSLAIDITTTPAAAILAVAGEVDVSNAPELRQAIEKAVAGDAPEVEIDLSAVPYIDSTGIGVLVGASHAAKDAGKTLAVVRPQRNVSRILQLLGVSSELNVRD